MHICRNSLHCTVLKNKIDIFFATGRITEEQYNELMDVGKEEDETNVN